MSERHQGMCSGPVERVPYRLWTRRQWLARAGAGLGIVALASLLRDQGLLAAAHPLGERALHPLAPQSPHFAARAKRVIWVFINGGPSHVDTWDYKPALERWHGRSIREFDTGFRDTTGFFRNQVGAIMRSPFSFRPRGQCGKYVADIFPYLGEHVDKMAFIHSGYTESNNHSQALFMMNTGYTRMGFPCVGSWVAYGLGSESQNLPAFVVLSDPKGRGLPKGHAANWSAGFLPGVYQGTHLKPAGAPIDNLTPAISVAAAQRRQLDLVRQMNETYAQSHRAESDLSARIESFELAFRMQTAAPEAMDLDREPAYIRRLYGLDEPRCAHLHASAWWRAVWSSEACASCRFTPEAWKISSLGTDIRTSPAITGNLPAKRISRWPDCSPIWPSAACWKKRWSSGAASSVAYRSLKSAKNRAATTIRIVSPSGSPVQASKGA